MAITIGIHIKCAVYAHILLFIYFIVSIMYTILLYHKYSVFLFTFLFYSSWTS